jgi:VCBS repeat-containing protein
MATAINGTSRNDKLSGTPKKDVIHGRAGNDTILGEGGNDIISGGSGNDVISAGAGRDFVRGGSGNDIISGGTGNDRLKGGTGNDAVSGDEGNDVISGGAGNDRLSGGSGNDRLNGGAGNDTLLGGAGNDRLDGGTGKDTLDGGAGNDRIDGGAGNDFGIYVAAENVAAHDTYDGGAGFDTLRLVLTEQEFASAAVQADIAAFRRFLSAQANTHDDAHGITHRDTHDDGHDGGHGDSLGTNGKTFEFKAFDLDARNWEALDVSVVPNPTPDPVPGPSAGGSTTPPGDVTPVNGAPVAVADAANAAEDGAPVTINVLANDTDPNVGDVLSLVSVGATQSGAGVSIVNGQVVYDPGTLFQSLGAGEATTDTFSYVMRDAAGATSSATVTVTLTGTNDGPVAVSDVAMIGEDAAGPAIGNVLSNDSDVDAGTVLQIATPGVFAGDYGTLTLNADGTYSYALNAHAQTLNAVSVATESFAYTATDGQATATSTLTMNVTGANDAPVTVGDANTIVEDAQQPIIGNVLVNDSDVDAGSVLSVGNPGTYVGTYGTLTLNADGSYSYAVNNDSMLVQGLSQGQLVTDTFDYQATDGTVSTASTLNISVEGRDDPSSVVSDFATTAEDETQLLTGNVLANDIDVDGSFVVAPGNFTGTYGTLTLAADGTYSYALDNASSAVQSLSAGQVVFETFDYQVGGSATPASFTVVVTGSNDNPTAAADSFVIDEGAAPTLPVLTNDGDIDASDVLSVVSASGAQHGTLSVTSGGFLEYVADANYEGTDSFTYLVGDGKGGFASATVDLTINAVADAPALGAADATVRPGEPIPLHITAALVDTDGSESLSPITIAGVPAGAVLSAGTDNGDGTWTVDPTALDGLTLTPPAGLLEGFALTVSATSTEASNGSMATAQAALNVTIDSTPEAPNLVVADASGAEDAPILLSIDVTNTAPYGSELQSVTIAGVPDGAVLSAGTDNGDGTWTLTPAELDGLTITPPANSDADFTLSVTATATDGLTGTTATSTGVVAVTVADMADTPILAATDASGLEDTAIPLDVSAALADMDGSEILSLTIAGVPAGAVLSAGTDNGDGSWTLSPADLPGLHITPTANADGAFTLTVTTTATESASGSTTAVSTTIDVVVDAVADQPMLTAAATNGIEGAAIPLDISAALTDLDGSETLSAVTIAGIPAGASLSAGTDNGDGTWTVEINQLSNLALTPAPGQVEPMTLNVSVTSTEAANGSAATSTVVLNIGIEAVADAPVVTINDATGLEDSPIALDIAAALGGPNSTETLASVTIAGVPQGAVLSAGTDNGDGSWTLSPAQLTGLTMTPAHDSADDFALTITATSVEPSNGSIATTTALLNVTVQAVADAPSLVVADAAGNEDSVIPLNIATALSDVDGSETLGVLTITGVPAGATLSAGTHNADGSWTLSADQLPGLTLTPTANSGADITLTITARSVESDNGSIADTTGTLHVRVDDVADAPLLTAQNASTAEDTPVPLQISAALVDADGSETLSGVTIAGVPQGAVLSAGTDNGNGTWTLSAADLPGLTLTPPANFYGTLSLAVTATSMESSTGATAESTATFDITVDPVIDPPAVAAPPTVTGFEDAPIVLNAGVLMNDPLAPGSVQSVTISGMPAGATLSAGTDNGDGTWTLSAADMPGLTLTPAPNSDADFSLTIATTVTAPDGTTTTASATTNVVVDAVADAPVLSVSGLAAGNEDSAIPISISVSGTDTDGSEFLSLEISGVPAGAKLSAGTDNGDGSWTLTPNQASGLTFLPPPNANGPYDLVVTAVSHETSNGDTATTSAIIHVDVAPMPDAPSAPFDTDGVANAVVEGAAGGTIVGITASAMDPDAGTSVTYRLADDAGGRFAIDAMTGLVTVAEGAVLNFESAASHMIVVEASDGALTNTSSFTINVLNAAPSALSDVNTATNLVPEGVAAGTAVGLQIAALDPGGGSVTYSLLDDAGGRFAIDATTGTVTVANGTLLNYETSTSHTIIVQATDGHLESSAAFTIGVINAEPSSPADINPASNTVQENAVGGTAVGITASAVDPSGGALTYSLIDNGAGHFAIDAATGVVTVAAGAKLDYETAPSYTITVGASDGTSVSSSVFTVNLINVVENVFSLADLNGSNGFAIKAAAFGDGLGVGVSTAGDVNGDGFADVIIGANTADPSGRTDAGAAYVIYGKASGAAVNLAALDTATGFRIIGATGTQLGTAVGYAGDVNHDGYADFATTAPLAGTPGTGKGFEIFGSASGPATGTFDVASLSGTNGFALTEANTNSFLGQSVSTVGDFNGDGYDDVAFGEKFGDSSGGFNQGHTYVVFGKGSAFAGAINTSGLNGVNGFVLSGAVSLDNSGEWIRSAGDVNGDGYDDMIIGASGANTATVSDTGAAYIVFGSANGLGGANLSSATLNSTFLDGVKGFTLEGVATGDTAGHSVSTAGDFNGDGYADVVVGAAQADPLGRADAGDVYVVFGKSGGFAATTSLGSLSGTNGFTIHGAHAGDNLGFSVSLAGDFNGDGIDDIVIGAPSADPDGVADAGRVYVIYGKAGGFDASIDLAAGLGEHDGFIVSGAAAGDRIGAQVHDAYDVNGDGFDDIILGSPTHASGTGEAYVIYGGNFSGSVDQLGGAGADTLVGTANDDILFGAQGNDMLHGGAGADFLNGGSGDDMMWGEAGNDVLQGGGGNDTFVFADGTGDDRITDFNALGGDTIDVSAFGFGNFTALMGVASDVAGNVVIQLDADDSVTLMNVQKSELGAGDFII